MTKVLTSDTAAEADVDTSASRAEQLSYWDAAHGVRVHLVDDAHDGPFDGFLGFLGTLPSTPGDLFALVGLSLSDQERDDLIDGIVTGRVRELDAGRFRPSASVAKAGAR